MHNPVRPVIVEDANAQLAARSFGNRPANAHTLTGALAGVYGDSTHSVQVTINSDGQVIAVANVAIAAGAGGLSAMSNIYASRNFF